MKKWIRLPGLLIFIVVVGLIALFWFVFADMLVKKGIEAGGSRAVGAKVELADADISLFPLGLDLTGLQVTNPDELMRNIVEIDHIHVSLETAYLLQRKIVSDEMLVDGVRLDTPRKVSGRLPDRPEPKKPEKDKDKKEGRLIELPKLSVSSVDDILKQEKLKTVEEVERFRSDIKAEREKYEALLKTLPDKQKLAGYQDRIKNLKGSKSLGSLFGAANEVSAVKKDIENDINQLKNVKGDLQGKVAEYQNRLVRLKDLPMEDFQRLKEKYSLSSQGLGNMALLLFGPQYGEWISKGISLYEKARPYLTKSNAGPEKVEEAAPVRGKGIDIKFREYEPIPDFLARIARVSLLLDVGDLKGEIRDIASDQTIYGKPVSFLFSGRKLKMINEVSFQGSLDRTAVNQAVDTVSGRFTGYRISDAVLSKDSGFPITLKNASADISLDLQIRNQQIESKVVSRLDSVVFSTGDTGENDLLRSAIRDALAGISQFQIKAGLTGTLEKNDVKVESDIDKVMGNAVKNAVTKQAKVFEDKLKQQLTEKTGGLLSGLDSSIGDFQFMDKELAERLKFGDGLLGDMKLF